ncbi:E3 ubiquitin-protein ligase TRIM58-like [Pristis pectinata]|uniref:E3 ubiquitin-protein ligase TRIM58-like n=1 Tax=Pristis pectinata TaxID=685728 RepID=UPI00223D920F|nr:E3 ubiquitin-protein ligase TRIM58-like [Pristis pectinata]
MIRINIIALQSQMQVLQERNKGILKMMNKAKKDAVEKYKARKLQLEIEEKTALERLSREQSRIASMNDSRSLKLEKKMKELEDFLKELNTLSIDKACMFIKRFHLVVDKMNTLAELLDDSKIEKMIEFPMDPSEFQRNRREMVRLYGHSPTLDPTTAHPSLFLFDNNTTVLGSFDAQRYPESEQRFDAKEQILGTQGVSYGRSYWEVKAEKTVGWKIGVCYVNMSRKGRGNECSLGQNDKSWCVQSGPFSFIAMHDRNKVKLNKITGQSITVGCLWILIME